MFLPRIEFFTAVSRSAKFGLERWMKFGKKSEHLARVEKEEYFAYFSGRSTAHALEVANVWKFENAVGLHALRNKFAKFAVPQSWRYVRPEEMRSFSRMKRNWITPD